MDYNKYLCASPTEQIKMMIAAIAKQQERLDPKNFLTASPIDKITMMANSIAREAERVKSGYYLTAPYHEQIGFIARQLQEQIKQETQLKIEEIEFHLLWLENSKSYIVSALDAIDKTLANVGNLEDTNTLLDKLIYYLKEAKYKREELKKLKD